MKYIKYISIFIVLVGLFSPIVSLYAQTLPSRQTVPNSTAPDSNYNLLAPLPCEPGSNPGCTPNENGGYTLKTYNPTENNNIGGYLNLMIRIFIGLCAVLAVVMIVLGGIEYMTSELISSKEAGKDRILHSIYGLLLALGAWTILNQINPDILKSDLETLTTQTVEVTLDQANFARTEKTAVSVGTTYTTSGTASSDVSNFINQHLKNGEPLTAITVDTAKGKAYFYVGNNWTTDVAVPINIGQGGVASAGQAQPGDLKTPIGTTTISGDIRIGNNGNAVISGNGYNLGAAFINLGVKDSAGNDRGIGFHGSYNDNLGTTNGCIRMKNEDLIALAPYMKTGVKVIIK